MSPPRLVYLVTEDWFFVAHRLPMARAAKAAGFEVHVATRLDRYRDAIATEGFHLHPVAWKRGSTNPLDFLASVKAERRIYRRLAPAPVHHVALQPTVVGSIAALGLPVVRVNALTGFGFAFTSNSPKARLLRPPLAGLLRYLLPRPGAAVLVENADDRATVERMGVP